jgi:3-phosphoglycerate kinase
MAGLEVQLEADSRAAERAFGQAVKMAPDCVGSQVEAMVATLKPGEVLLLENPRFYPREEKNDLLLTNKPEGLRTILHRGGDPPGV